jgi:putative nucleotidyltransferase with HDIG domain
MSQIEAPTRLVRDARDLAQILLAGDWQRWRHTIGVARRAEELTATLSDEDAEVLLAAAWLHDIGYADQVTDTGFHPLDGARYLDRLGWPRRISALVAHHSDAASVACVRNLHHELSAYPLEESAVADALTYADQTVGPDGQRMTLCERLADMLRRHGPNSPNAAAHHRREARLRATAQRVERRLAGLASRLPHQRGT